MSFKSRNLDSKVTASCRVCLPTLAAPTAVNFEYGAGEAKQLHQWRMVDLRARLGMREERLGREPSKRSRAKARVLQASAAAAHLKVNFLDLSPSLTFHFR